MTGTGFGVLLGAGRRGGWKCGIRLLYSDFCLLREEGTQGEAPGAEGAGFHGSAVEATALARGRASPGHSAPINVM